MEFGYDNIFLIVSMAKKIYQDMHEQFLDNFLEELEFLFKFHHKLHRNVKLI